MPETKKETVWTEFQGAGSAYMAIETYKRGELDASGHAPVFITPEMIEKKKSRSIN